ncbi:GH25 family lysozyme [Parablautia muri]|nr:GH25 family lysozyme [Parablautia muri]
MMKKSKKSKSFNAESFFEDDWEEEVFEEDDWNIDWKEEADKGKGADKKLVAAMCMIGACIVVVLGVVFAVFLRGSRKEREVLEAQMDLTQNQLAQGEPVQDEFPREAGGKEEDSSGKEQDAGLGEESKEPKEDGEAESLPSPVKKAEPSVGALDDAQDPQTFGGAPNEGSGAEVTVSDIDRNEAVGLTGNLTVGIDVSKYQGTIDWQKVKESGVEFAMVRVGYRAKSTGEIFEDPTARYNMQEAQAAGIKLGAYFFSSAITDKEAREEAAFTRDMIAKYKITYPVAFNCEDFQSPDSRQHGLDIATRTGLACAFLDEISAAGYTPMFYASKGELEGSAYWDTQTLAGKYKIWVAQYPSLPYPQTGASSYTGTHDMWQYTSQGTVAGISKKTDVNIAYFGYTKEAEAKDDTPAEIVKANPEVGIIFTEVNETVTAKQETNLRSEPSTLSDETIVGKLVHGDTAVRTGIGHNGWSRLTYNGQTLYAVTSYLTTNMEDTGQQAPPQGPVYTPVNEQVTAKMETNLRSEPGTGREDTIVGLLHNGEVLTRVGVGDNGWSQLEFNGQIVYAVSSYLTAAQ